jgi:hypothetical protein
MADNHTTGVGGRLVIGPNKFRGGERTMNTRQKKFILEELCPFILRDAGNGFIMEDWLIKGVKEYVGPDEALFDGVTHRVPVCDTAACIGGSIAFLKKVSKNYINSNASKILGITNEQAHGLFYRWMDGQQYYYYSLTSWPKKYRDRFVVAKTPYKKAQCAVALLKEVVRTEGKCLDPEVRG